MEYVLFLLFVLVFIVWLLFLRVGKGGIIDEALATGLLEIDRFKKED